MSARAFQGCSFNASGTRIAGIKAIGTNAVDTTVRALDSGEQVQWGSMWLSVKAAVHMGILDRYTGVLAETNPPASTALW